MKQEVKSQEENILKTIIEKESWEDVIYYIVSLEQLNPWDVNLVKLTDSFIKFIKNAEDLDFRIPAKVIFVAAILLRLKADYLSIFEEEEESVEEMLKEDKPFAELGIDPNL
ncbi:MAG: segregation/condensation protein A, partial [Candidatus Aenigmatarchaeota archaeon]